MGCASSKLSRKNSQQEIEFRNGDCINHVVSLTSSTYGLLNLGTDYFHELPISEIVIPEVINALELMKDLEEEEEPISVHSKKRPLSRRGSANFDSRSPLKTLNQKESTKKSNRFGGKENRGVSGSKSALKVSSFSSYYLNEESSNSTITTKDSFLKTENSRVDSGSLRPRRSLSPLFDPELVASFEKELSEEAEQIKKMVSATPNSDSILGSFKKICPPGGENAVVIYTTTLRGIRKTFEDCNVVRSIIESHNVLMFERDVSMDLGFREDLRRLIRQNEVKVPVVFVRGRLIGGAQEMTKLEEEGNLGILFSRIPRAVAGGCECCAGIRFTMCMECSGSCKVLDEDGKNTVRCEECNENGLIQCPLCC